ncbi:MAG: VIT family protein [Dysgonamonadaceae bacterium]|nr:VIT family protein [Dysgonamonadaceae bacterium]
MNKYRSRHYTTRSNWLRAAVLGANDGILSTTSIVIGIAAANPERQAIVLAALAGLVAGACSMAAGEYVSVSSQTDVETGDLRREKEELKEFPEFELQELADIYRKRGLDENLSMEVAKQLMASNALEAHARDELGINDMTKPKPLQAAIASASAFISGGILPFLVAISAPVKEMVFFQYGFAILFLAVSGAVAAKMGGCHIRKSMLRICFWGTVAMLTTAAVGYLFGTTIG